MLYCSSLLPLLLEDAARLVTQSCPTLCHTMHCSPPGSAVYRIFQAIVLNGLSFPPPGNLPVLGTEPTTCSSCAGRQSFTTEPPGKLRVEYAYKMIWNSAWDLCFFFPCIYLLNHLSQCGHIGIYFTCWSIIQCNFILLAKLFQLSVGFCVPCHCGLLFIYFEHFLSFWAPLVFKE